MKIKITIFFFAITTILPGLAPAQEPTDFSEAKALSAELGKPLLMEFIRSDCEYCQKATSEAETSDIIKNALKSVVHISLNVREGDGIALSEEYKAGNTYPVFVLANSKGDVIRRWVGYNGANRFVSMLKMALSDLTTIKDREINFNRKPNPSDALFLAGYYSDTREYLKAVNYYQQAKKLGGSPAIDYEYNIFQNMASAAWNYEIPFEEILPSADAVLDLKNKKPESVIKMARVISRVARKLDGTGKLAKYIQAGLDVTARSNNEKYTQYHDEFKMDYALHVDNDTAKALGMKKTSLGEGWETKPDKFYDFAEWCLERKINLTEAKKYALQAAKLATEGPFKGKTIKTAAEIYDALGDTKTAVSLMQEAMEQDPANDYYETIWNDFRKKLQGRK